MRIGLNHLNFVQCIINIYSLNYILYLFWCNLLLSAAGIWGRQVTRFTDVPITNKQEKQTPFKTNTEKRTYI